MYKDASSIISSATDVVNYLACEHLTQLDLTHLDAPMPVAAASSSLELLREKGAEWETAHLDRLRNTHPDLLEISSELRQREAAAATRQAMQQGRSLIYQATFLQQGFFAKADFLRRIDLASSLGSWSYEVLDTKLARHPKPSHILQLCVYSWLTSLVQGIQAPLMYIVVSDGSEKPFRVADYSHYFRRLSHRYLEAIAARRSDTYPHPCDKCPECRWRERCDSRRETDDHLWRVANITRQQIAKLTAARISTLTALGTATSLSGDVPIDPAVFDRLRAQAAMHLKGQVSGEPEWVHRNKVEAEKGFARLPPPDEGDLFFDMEGDPFYEDGLEYLFGLSYREDGRLEFKGFWGHDRAAEKKAFEEFVDFVFERRKKYPDLHIYHYADYERRALESLMQLHDTREEEVDTLFRERRLVDLYRVVCEGIVSSTPSYSIKDIERFYRDKRAGGVVSAGESIVQYETWRVTQDPQLLIDLERYNQDDCESTAQLHGWLLSIVPPEHSWRSVGKVERAPDTKPSIDTEKARKAAEKKRLQLEARVSREQIKASLQQEIPTTARLQTTAQQAAELTAALLDFHRREAKPVWWKIFQSQESTLEQLLADPETIGGLVFVRAGPSPTPRSNPTGIYRYPKQETKIKVEKSYTRLDTLADIQVLAHDPDQSLITFRQPKVPLPKTFSLGPEGPYRTKELEDAIQRFATASLSKMNPYRAVEAFLRRDLPTLRGRKPGSPIVATNPPALEDVIEAVASLDDSYLFIQGPPGAGKTYMGSHVIVELLRRGHSVGISSNSHKAISHLLGEIDALAVDRGVTFRGLQKTNAADEPGWRNIQRTDENGDIEDSDPQLVAGTAWLFARPKLERRFSHLFVDEAGQVSIANLVAMGLAARNLVLLGDQMQLGQPIQASHPGHAGESTLEYLLQGQSVIAPDRGIFLAETYRMHPHVCEFISQAVYDGQLKSAAGRDRQQLLITSNAHPTLSPTGLRFREVDHEGCTQSSEPEALVIAEIYADLLRQRWRNVQGDDNPLTTRDILIVTPYNLQVQMLKRHLPADARIGTVDLFQGQEAAVVLVSLVSSSGDDLPRDIEFLYSKNRLNVAISRARCLAVVVACHKLLDVRCRSIEQMGLVNTLCWAHEFAGRPRTHQAA